MKDTTPGTFQHRLPVLTERLRELDDDLRELARLLEGQGSDPTASALAAELRSSDFRRIQVALERLCGI